MKKVLRVQIIASTGLSLLFLASFAAAQQPAGPQAAVPPPAPEAPADPPRRAAVRSDRIVVPAGTKLPLILENGISTRNARPGSAVYFVTTFPVTQDDRIVIPVGSYVSGEIIEAKRPGKIKGRGEIRFRLTRLILPNGYTVDLNAVPENTSAGGNESVDEEGKIKGDTQKGRDVGTVAKTTGAGAGIGAISGGGKGAGIGAGAGAAIGLATVLLTRGPELVLPRGTTVDITLDRALYLDSDRIQFRSLGRPTGMPGPPYREPTPLIP